LPVGTRVLPELESKHSPFWLSVKAYDGQTTHTNHCLTPVSQSYP